MKVQNEMDMSTGIGRKCVCI